MTGKANQGGSALAEMKPLGQLTLMEMRRCSDGTGSFRGNVIRKTPLLIGQINI
jgi:hypothetical protein